MHECGVCDMSRKTDFKKYLTEGHKYIPRRLLYSTYDVLI